MAIKFLSDGNIDNDLQVQSALTVGNGSTSYSKIQNNAINLYDSDGTSKGQIFINETGSSHLLMINNGATGGIVYFGAPSSYTQNVIIQGGYLTVGNYLDIEGSLIKMDAPGTTTAVDVIKFENATTATPYSSGHNLVLGDIDENDQVENIDLKVMGNIYLQVQDNALVSDANALTFSGTLGSNSITQFWGLNAAGVVQKRTKAQFASDAGIVRTTTNQTVAGDKTFSGATTFTSSITQTGGATTTLSGDLDVQGSGISLVDDIIFSGSGRIQGIDTVSASTDAANKAYVDAHPSGTVTSVALSGGTGISISGSPITGSGTITVTNSAPDQTVALTAGTGISVSGTYPNFTITNSSPSSGGTMSNWKLTADSGGTATIDDAETVDIVGGTNITTVRSGNNVTINTSATTNTGTVTSVATGTGLTGGTITSSGTLSLNLNGLSTTTSGGNADLFAVINTAGSQYKIAAGNINISTFNNNAGYVTSSGVTSVATGSGLTGGTITGSGTVSVDYGASGLVADAPSGTGSPEQDDYVLVGLDSSSNGETRSFALVDLPFAPSGTVSGVTSVAVSGGTGISISGSPITSSGTITVTNSAPDQTVALTGGTGISISGTYPNFTITNSSPSSGGTVTSVGMTVAAGLDVSGSPITGSGSFALSLDLSEFTDMTAAMTGTDKFIVLDSGNERKKAANEIGLSIFNNDAGFTTNSGTVTSVGISAGTGISVSGSPVTGSGSITVTNSAPDQTVALTAGTGISVSGTYPNFTITNSSPSSGGTMSNWKITADNGGTATIDDAETVDIAGGTNINTARSGNTITVNNEITNNNQLINGAGYTTNTGTTTASNTQTFTNKSGNISQWTNDSGYLTSAGSMSTWKLTADSGGTATIDNAETVDIAGGTNITTARSGNTVTINTSATTNTGTVTSVGIAAGTGISVSGSPVTSSGSITVTNSAPDQTVALTAGTGISVSGTYPNFTITNSSPASGSGITGSGTSGKVAKFTGGSSIGDGDITFGTNTITLGDPTSSSTATMFVDTQNRRVGYRTINPTSAFEVVGTINTQGLNCNEKQFFSPKDNNYIQAGNYGNGEFFGNSGFGNDDKQPKFSAGWGNTGVFVEHQKIETIKIQQNGFYNWFTNGCILIPAQGTNTYILVDSITVYKSAGSNPNMGQVYFGFCEQASPTSNCQMFGNNKSFQFWGSIASQVTSRTGTWVWQSDRPYNTNNSEAADTASMLNRPFIARVGSGSEVSTGTFNGPWYIQIKYRNVNYLAGFVNNVDRTVTSTGSGQNSRTQFLGSSVTNFSTICPSNANIPPDADQSYHFDNSSGCNGNNGYPAAGDIVYTSATGSTVVSAGYIFLYSGGGSRYYLQIGASGTVVGSSCTDSVSECDQPDS